MKAPRKKVGKSVTAAKDTHTPKNIGKKRRKKNDENVTRSLSPIGQKNLSFATPEKTRQRVSGAGSNAQREFGLLPADTQLPAQNVHPINRLVMTPGPPDSFASIAQQQHSQKAPFSGHPFPLSLAICLPRFPSPSESTKPHENPPEHHPFTREGSLKKPRQNQPLEDGFRESAGAWRPPRHPSTLSSTV